jgi:hypothetical protein
MRAGRGVLGVSSPSSGSLTRWLPQSAFDCSMGDEFVKDLTSALRFRLGVERLLPALWALSDLALVLPSVHPVASSAHPS